MGTTHVEYDLASKKLYMGEGGGCPTLRKVDTVSRSMSVAVYLGKRCHLKVGVVASNPSWLSVFHMSRQRAKH